MQQGLVHVYNGATAGVFQILRGVQKGSDLACARRRPNTTQPVVSSNTLAGGTFDHSGSSFDMGTLDGHANKEGFL